jgi:hypothetical protein
MLQIHESGEVTSWKIAAGFCEIDREMGSILRRQPVDCDSLNSIIASLICWEKVGKY